MKNTTVKETLNPVRQMIARRILASPLAQYVGYPSQPDSSRLEYLTMIAAGDDNGERFSYFRVDFRKAGSNIDFCIDIDPASWRAEPKRDERGDEFNEYVLTFRTSWPSHGSHRPGVNIARLEFYREVTLMAASLEGEFAGDNQVYLHLDRTKEKREEDEAKAKEDAKRRAIRTAIASVSHNMRVGGKPNVVMPSLLADVPDGKYEDMIADKKYMLAVDNMVGLVERTA